MTIASCTSASQIFVNVITVIYFWFLIRKFFDNDASGLFSVKLNYPRPHRKSIFSEIGATSHIKLSSPKLNTTQSQYPVIFNSSSNKSNPAENTGTKTKNKTIQTPIQTQNPKNSNHSKSTKNFKNTKHFKNQWTCPFDFKQNLNKKTPPRYILDPTKFIINVSPFGPNNQFHGFRDTILMAIYLNRTLILPKFFKHGSDPSYSTKNFTKNVQDQS